MIKKITTFAVILGICFILALTPGSAQITLDQCIELGKKNNPSLQKTVLEKNLDRPASMAAWGQFLPRITTGYSIGQSKFYNPTFLNPDGSVATFPLSDSLETDTGWVYYEIPVPEGKRRNSNWYLRVDETIFDGGQNYFNLKNSQITKRIRDNNLIYQEFALRAQVTAAYASTVAAERTLDLFLKVVEQRRLQLSLARTRFETGSVTRRDVLQAEVDLGRSLSDSLTAILNVNRSFENLNILIGLPLDTTYDLANLPMLFKPEWNADSLVQLAVERRADLVSTQLSLDINRNDLYTARGSYLPFLTASYIHSRSEQSGANTSFTVTPRNRYSEVGLTVSWTLFDRFTRSLRNQEAAVNRRQAELSANELALEIERQVRAASDRLISLYNQSEVAAQNSRYAEETLKFEQDRYRLGSATVIELGVAQVSFIQAKTDQITLETEFYIALGELESATGIILRKSLER
ncbi:TolC family protein [bacterium]|nr:TolC family protein [bacterium]